MRAAALLATAAVAHALGCGGRTSLDEGPLSVPPPSGAGGSGAGGGSCAPREEICNGRDDDCDGAVDESDPDLGMPCQTGLPDACAPGVWACQAGALVCGALAGREEICNGLDDDCNGVADDGDPGGGAQCDTGALGACGEGTVHCEGGALGCVPNAVPTPELCNGVDDDCNGIVDEPPVCTRRVFVTSQIFLGTLGGLTGADAACQSLADAAVLGGTYKAWLSSSTVDAKDRLTHVGAPYVLVDGTVVADDWSAFASEHHQSPIDLTESFGPPPLPPSYLYPIVLTGTDTDGTVVKSSIPNGPYSTCGDWQSTAGSAAVGRADKTTGGWTKNSAGRICDTGAALYCVEQ